MHRCVLESFVSIVRVLATERKCKGFVREQFQQSEAELWQKINIHMPSAHSTAPVS
jgi:hypothetical protein